MIDTEKIINALENCTQYHDTCINCEYNKYATCKTSLMIDALATLKEQEEQIKNRDESLEKAREEIKWLREMLKDQEPKQIIRKQGKRENSDGSIDYFAEWYCPHCGELLNRGFDAPWIEFCYKCGNAVKWE